MSRSAFRQSTLKAPASKRKKVPHRTKKGKEAIRRQHGK